MNIKSLLIGSAAALVAVSGARAADVIVADPEPVEYVRVCDAYGTGFFYIPGTETCIKIGGYVRYQIDIAERIVTATTGPSSTPITATFPWLAGDLGAGTTTATLIGVAASQTGWTKNTRGQLTIDVREETEYGTLRGFIAFQGNSNTGNVTLDSAFIELGTGNVLHIGFSDNAFDGGINGETDSLGGAKVNRIAYTFSGGSWDATISLDDDNASNNLGGGGLPDFVPNVSGNVGGSVGGFDVRLFGAYDNLTGEGAVKARLGYTMGNTTFQLAGYYTSGKTYVLGDRGTFMLNFPVFGIPTALSLPTWGEWSVQGAIQHKFNDKLTATLNAGYFDNLGHGDNFPPFIFSADMWNIGATIDYKITNNFNMLATVTYTDVDINGPVPIDAEGATSGFIRFQRSF